MKCKDCEFFTKRIMESSPDGTRIIEGVCTITKEWHDSTDSCNVSAENKEER